MQSVDRDDDDQEAEGEDEGAEGACFDFEEFLDTFLEE
jgi:hypothetical protein